MKINPVHALLEVIRQQARAQPIDGTRVRASAGQAALKEQLRAEILQASTAGAQTTIEQILAESKDTKFRLEMLERLVSDRLGIGARSSESAFGAEHLAAPEKPKSATMASSSATDAMNQTVPQSHGRAWHSQPDLWSNAEAEFLKYHVSDSGMKGQGNPIGIAEKFTPTVEDIETALFKEDIDPAEFARVFMARGEVPLDTSGQGIGPRLVPIFIGLMMLLTVAYLIF
jgi:hypothetical protein